MRRIPGAIEGFSMVRKAPVSACLALALMTIGTPALAQSDHGCVSLEYATIPSIEGADGMFYRIDPDLVMDTRLPDASVAAISRLSRALVARGTKLVYVPVPTKGLVLPDRMGRDAEKFGFDVRIARALYADSIANLRSKEVTTVDVLTALVAAPEDEPSFFQADPRMTSAGLMRLAHAIGHELGSEHAGDENIFVEEQGRIGFDSPERSLLQLSCQADLPEVETGAYALRLEPEWDDREPPRAIVAVGSGITGGRGRGYPGFLSETLGRRNIHEVIAADAVSAMAGYLTSNDFRRDAPEVLIWQVPVGTNPLVFGDQPMGELIAAVTDDCDPALTLTEISRGTYRAELGTTTEGLTLRYDSTDEPVADAVFRFAAPDGAQRTRSVVRQDATTATNRVYLPMTGLWPGGAASVTVSTGIPSTSAPRISVCRG